MDFVSMKTFVVLQLLLLLLGSVNAQFVIPHPLPHLNHHPTPPPSHENAPAPAPSSHYHHHHHHPTYPPTHHHHYPHPPSHSPGSSPPTYYRKHVAVQGVVYCKPCKYSRRETLTGATPISGAIVKLQCYNTKHSVSIEAKTDKNGYFFVGAPKTVTNYGAHKCKVYLVSSPLPWCSRQTNLHGGVGGATLMHEKTKTSPLPFALYNVGPFAFETSKC